MKKIIFALASIIILLLTIHFSTPFYGGVPGIISRIQARAVNQVATITGDPGGCAMIRGFWGKTLREKLRKRCLKNYIQKSVNEKSDCRVQKLVTDMHSIAGFWLRDEYRQRCLIGHYQIMLGNSLTQEWLPERCLAMRDKLVIFENYFENVLSKGKKQLSSSDLTDGDIFTIEQCERFLDTPKIYSFLRDITPSEQERNYIESQKKRVFELK